MFLLSLRQKRGDKLVPAFANLAATPFEGHVVAKVFECLLPRGSMKIDRVNECSVHVKNGSSWHKPSSIPNRRSRSTMRTLLCHYARARNAKDAGTAAKDAAGKRLSRQRLRAKSIGGGCYIEHIQLPSAEGA